MSSSKSKTPVEKPTSEFHVLTQEEFFAPIQDPYAKRLSESPIEDLIDDYNPGATKEDGSINFECHCMSHMVASPCGHEFRQAMTCQRNAGEEAEQGMCAEEFIAFMDCVVQTKCFKKTEDIGDSEFDDSKKE